MAKAEIIGTRIRVALELSEEETATLYALLMNVGGPVQNTPREHCQTMCRALDDVVDGSILALYEKYSEVLEGQIDFVHQGA